MKSKDFLQRFIFSNRAIRGEYIHLEESYTTILKQHNYPETLRRLLGEALSVAALLAAIIKFEGRLTLQFRGQGKLNLLLAQCDNQFHLRGLIKWQGDLSHHELMHDLADGVLVIMIDSPISNRHYQGMVAWRGDSLTESIEHYFNHSEQLNTKLWLAVDDQQAAGILLQVLPSGQGSAGVFNDEDKLKEDWEQIIHLTNKVNQEDLLKLDNNTLLQYLYADEEISLHHPVPVSFACTCSRKKSEDAIYLLGREEAEDELKEKHYLLVTCDFCNQEYLFDRLDVATLFADRDKPPDTKIH